jgi:hypothetical protein
MAQLALLGSAKQDCGSSVAAVLELYVLQLLRDFKFEQAESMFEWLRGVEASCRITAAYGEVIGADELNGALDALMHQV